MGVTLNLTDEEAYALYQYVITSYEGDDTEDEFRMKIGDTLDKPEPQIRYYVSLLTRTFRQSATNRPV